MGVKRLDSAAVGQFVGDDDDVSPFGPGVGGVSDQSVAYGVNGFAAIGIASRIFVPVFAEVILLAKIEGVVPVVLRIAGLREEVFLAYGISERLSDDEVRFAFRINYVPGDLRRRAAAGASGCCENEENYDVNGSGQYVFPFPAG